MKLRRLAGLALSAASLLASRSSLAAEPPAAVEAKEAPPFGQTHELMLHGFRNPSIGLEYRHGFVGVHAGAYTTIIGHAADAEATSRASWFFKAGLTGYFLPVKLTSDRYSSLFVSASYLRGTNNGWDNAVSGEIGARWAAWKGLDLRLGVAALVVPGEKVRVNPTPGISWSFVL